MVPKRATDVPKANSAAMAASLFQRPKEESPLVIGVPPTRRTYHQGVCTPITKGGGVHHQAGVIGVPPRISVERMARQPKVYDT